MSFSFIHAADIHLDSPMQGLVNYKGAPTAHLRAITRQAFESLIIAALKHRVDFVIIAGDLYDGAWADFTPGLFFKNVISRLNGIPVYLIYGNHDAEKKMIKKIPLPENVFLFRSDQAHSIVMPNLPVVLHGQSFETAAVSENLVKNYPQTWPDYYNIGILHTGLEGSAQHANYAPCALSELKNFGYHYWALGHIHIAEILSENPHIVFPGCLQGRHIKETGRKGAVLVTVDDKFNTSTTSLYFDHARWVVINLTLENAQTYEEVQLAIENQLNALTNTDSENDTLPEVFAVRLILEGSTECHTELTIKQEEIIEFVREVANSSSPPIWIEEVKIKTIAKSEKVALPPLVIDIIKSELEKLKNNPLADTYIAEQIAALKGYIPSELSKNEVFPQPDAGPLLQEALEEGYNRLLQYLQHSE